LARLLLSSITFGDSLVPQSPPILRTLKIPRCCECLFFGAQSVGAQHPPTNLPPRATGMRCRVTNSIASLLCYGLEDGLFGHVVPGALDRPFAALRRTFRRSNSLVTPITWSSSCWAHGGIWSTSSCSGWSGRISRRESWRHTRHSQQASWLPTVPNRKPASRFSSKWYSEQRVKGRPAESSADRWVGSTAIEASMSHIGNAE